MHYPFKMSTFEEQWPEVKKIFIGATKCKVMISSLNKAQERNYAALTRNELESRGSIANKSIDAVTTPDWAMQRCHTHY